MSWIEWCKCGRYILTTGQQREKMPCEACQKEHAQTLKDRFDKLNEEET